MANLTEKGHFETIQVVSCTASLHGNHYLYSLVALNILLSITATLGNTLILVALHKESSLHPPSKLLFRCLTATDLLVGVFAQPLFVLELLFITQQRQRLCHSVVSVNDIAGRILGAVSLCTLTAISVDRLLALLSGIRYRRTFTLKRACGLVTCIWILFISFGCARRFSPDVISRVTSALIYTFLTASAFCYTKIYLTLRHHQVQLQDKAQERQPNGVGIPLNIARYKKTVSTALWVQLTLVVCYLPYGIVSAISYPLLPSHNLGIRITLTLLLFNSSLNPILYCWKIRGVRRAVNDIIRQMCCWS